MMSNRRTAVYGLGVLLAAAAGNTTAQEARVEPFDLHTEANAIVERSLEFLASTQEPNGGWKGFDDSTDPAITALAATCFVQSPRYGPDHPIVKRALGFVLTFARADGGIYVDGQGLRNYQTSVCLMMTWNLTPLTETGFKPYASC